MRERGFSLLEVLFTLSTLAVVGLGIAGGVVTGHQATRGIETEALVASRGYEYQERLMAIPFGSAAEGTATSGELNELFDEDPIFGSVSLHKLASFGPAEFELDGFPVRGVWTVTIDRDLDGDGIVETDDGEGRDDLLRIAVSFEGKRIAQVVRFDPTGAS